MTDLDEIARCWLNGNAHARNESVVAEAGYCWQAWRLEEVCSEGALIRAFRRVTTEDRL